jgi:hypothetical protein
VVLFDARGELVRLDPLQVWEGSVASVAFGPQGRIAAGSQNGGVVLFDDRGVRLQPEALRVEGLVTSVTFGPEGQIAAGLKRLSGGVAGGVALFDDSGKRLRPEPLKVNEGEVTSVVFGPRDQVAAGFGTAASGVATGGVVLFDADPASWRRKAAQTVNRNFTWLEWTQYFTKTTYRRTIRSLPWPHDLPEVERKPAEAFEKEHPEGSDAE